MFVLTFAVWWWLLFVSLVCLIASLLVGLAVVLRVRFFWGVNSVGYCEF